MSRLPERNIRQANEEARNMVTSERDYCPHGHSDPPACQQCNYALIQRARVQDEIDFNDQARRAALWDAAGEPALALLRETLALLEDLDCVMSPPSVDESDPPIVQRIRALLIHAEEQQNT